MNKLKEKLKHLTNNQKFFIVVGIACLFLITIPLSIIFSKDRTPEVIPEDKFEFNLYNSVNNAEITEKFSIEIFTFEINSDYAMNRSSLKLKTILFDSLSYSYNRNLSYSCRVNVTDYFSSWTLLSDGENNIYLNKKFTDVLLNVSIEDYQDTKTSLQMDILINDSDSCIPKYIDFEQGIWIHVFQNILILNKEYG